MKKIWLLWASGSIGKQTIDILRHKRDFYELVSFSVGKNLLYAIEILREFDSVKIVSIESKQDADKLKNLFPKYEIHHWEEWLIKVATSDIDLLITGIVGSIGLIPTYKAIEKGITIGLANKETLVAWGDIIMKKAKEKWVQILPVDSEHSAIFQCLNGENKKAIKRLLITASGWALRDWDIERMKNVSREDVLKHPNWSMGQKITVDSATMMNKWLEVIEAHHLFEVPYERIEVLIHRQSIVHSMVEFVDNAIIAQLWTADMRVPIQLALSYPMRQELVWWTSIDFTKVKELNFETSIPKEKYPCFHLALEAGKAGNSYPTVLNATNEVLVEYFLSNQIKYSQISGMLKEVLDEHKCIKNPTLEEIILIDKQTREVIRERLRKG